MKLNRLRLLRPRSIQGRFTLTAGLLSLIIFAVIGAGFDIAVRNKVEGHVLGATQRAAVDWIASMHPGRIPRPEPAGHVDILQLVDSHGRVVAGSRSGVDRPPISTMRPAQQGFHNSRGCLPDGECMLVTTLRVAPQATYLLWNGEPHYVYAAGRLPPILATHYLEVDTVVMVLLASAVAAWLAWLTVGRTLRPVRAIREKVSEAAESGVSLRLPEPPGDDEIARLARASNRFLRQLEEAVNYQRRFASMASHELRSPVAALRAQLEEALAYPDDVDPHETIRAALRTTERFQGIIDELLAYTRIQCARPAPPEPLDLEAMAREEVAARSVGTPIRLHMSGRPTVFGTRLQVAGILTNLLANAQRHARSCVDLTVERAGRHALVIVQDDGDGIAPEDRERVFEPFIRLAEGRRRDPGGSGLGLAICREAAMRNNGTLTIEDSPRGARFVLRLPILDVTSEESQPECAQPQPLRPVRS